MSERPLNVTTCGIGTILVFYSIVMWWGLKDELFFFLTLSFVVVLPHDFAHAAGWYEEIVFGSALAIRIQGQQFLLDVLLSAATLESERQGQTRRARISRISVNNITIIGYNQMRKLNQL